MTFRDAPSAIDELGFRIDPDVQDPIGAPGILLIGDSVTFGPGVTERETFAGRLRRAHPDRRIYNAGAIGYDVNDDAEAVTRLLPALNVRDLFVIYNLNDLSTRTTEDVPNALDAWLSQRSKLYLFAKGSIRDTSMTFFEAALAPYHRDAALISAALTPLVRMRDAAVRANVHLTVVVLPYEPQVRTSPAPDLTPQRVVTGFLRGRQIRFEDARPKFASAGGRPADLFLFDDPMHLSAAGHDVVFRLLQTHLLPR